MTTFIRWELAEDRHVPGTWRVEGFSYDGEDCYVTIFSGPDSLERASAYLDWMTSNG